MIVDTNQFGKTVVQISDECIVNTPKERGKVDRDIADAAWACHVASKRNGMKSKPDKASLG